MSLWWVSWRQHKTYQIPGANPIKNSCLYFMTRLGKLSPLNSSRKDQHACFPETVQLTTAHLLLCVLKCYTNGPREICKLWMFIIRLECLSFASLSDLVQRMLAKQGPTLLKNLLGALLQGRLLALTHKNRPHCKGLPGTNTLATNILKLRP